MTLLKILHEINKSDWEFQRKQRRKSFFMSCSIEELKMISQDLGKRINDNSLGCLYTI